MLPRWAVVASGASPAVSFAEVVPTAEWAPRLLARVFRSSMERHLLRRDKERLLGDLLSVGVRVTHDLRTPLGGILSATEVLEEIQGGPDAQSLSQPIVESAQDLVKIINQLSLVAKGSGKPGIHQPFSMESSSRARDGADGGEIHARRNHRFQTGGVAGSDRRPGKDRESYGNSSLKTPCVTQAKGCGSRSGGMHRVKCIGSGFETMARVYRLKKRQLFHPFNRLHETNAARGLGLPVVERMVNLQGGQCGYESPPQGGSCFFFTLPGAPQPTV